jgi:hypothetical protein
MSTTAGTTSSTATQQTNVPQTTTTQVPVVTTTVAATDIPNEKVLVHAAKIALEQDKPILLDYYVETKNGTAFLGEDSDTKEKILVKNPEEYTSPVKKMFKANDDYIIVTENSVYVVSKNIKKKTISSSSSV